MASRYSGIENAKVSEKLPYVQPGNYLFEIEAVKDFQSRAGQDCFVAEFKVVEATGEQANPVGSLCSYMVVVTGNDSALGNIKGFVSPLSGIPLDQITAQHVDNLTQASNPAKGEKVRAEAFNIKTKKGTDFTKVTFRSATSGTAPPASGATSSTKSKSK